MDSSKSKPRKAAKKIRAYKPATIAKKLGYPKGTPLSTMFNQFFGHD